MLLDAMKLAAAILVVLALCGLIAYTVRTLACSKTSVTRLAGTLVALTGTVAATPAVIHAVYSI